MLSAVTQGWFLPAWKQHFLSMICLGECESLHTLKAHTIYIYHHFVILFLSFFLSCRMSASRGCLCCVKYLMFIFNLIFWVSSVLGFCRLSVWKIEDLFSVNITIFTNLSETTVTCPSSGVPVNVVDRIFESFTQRIE